MSNLVSACPQPYLNVQQPIYSTLPCPPCQRHMEYHTEIVQHIDPQCPNRCESFHYNLDHGTVFASTGTCQSTPLHIKVFGPNLTTIDPAMPVALNLHENMRTLEQSLFNPIYGNRNVYIRGLHPGTNDETLTAYAARFGSVETPKTIIDTATVDCKGFGFVKYIDVCDSQSCIRGFYRLGYEVSFARKSFDSRLEAKSDQSSTNLYVSNLPKDMNQAELAAIFMKYTVVSSIMLHDPQGNSRGAGFARFESRDMCEEIIRKFHGQPIGDEGLGLQVRYPDTPAQKELKQISFEGHQFRVKTAARSS